MIIFVFFNYFFWLLFAAILICYLFFAVWIIATHYYLLFIVYYWSFIIYDFFLQFGLTKLFKAAARGNLPLVKELIKKGADVNFTNSVSVRYIFFIYVYLFLICYFYNLFVESCVTYLFRFYRILSTHFVYLFVHLIIYLSTSFLAF